MMLGGSHDQGQPWGVADTRMSSLPNDNIDVRCQEYQQPQGLEQAAAGRTLSCSGCTEELPRHARDSMMDPLTTAGKECM